MSYYRGGCGIHTTHPSDRRWKVQEYAIRAGEPIDRCAIIIVFVMAFGSLCVAIVFTLPHFTFGYRPPTYKPSEPIQRTDSGEFQQTAVDDVNKANQPGVSSNVTEISENFNFDRLPSDQDYGNSSASELPFVSIILGSISVALIVLGLVILGRKFYARKNQKQSDQENPRSSDTRLDSLGQQGEFTQSEGELIHLSSKPNEQSSKIETLLSDELCPGQEVNFTLYPGRKGFVINVIHDEEGHIAFKFSPSSTEDVFSGQTCVNGVSKDEEDDQPYFPFRAGKKYRISIQCEPSLLKVFVDGQYFVYYQLQNGTVDAVKHVGVAGDFKLE